MGLKILATADLHLGMKFSGYPEVQSELSEARFRTLEGMVQRANSEGCNLFVIAGDLFERVTMPKKDVLRAVGMLNSFQGELLVVLPGNHDYLAGSSGSLWKGFREASGDRVLLLDRRQCYDLEHYDLAVKLYPGPCDAKHSGENAISWIRPSAGEDGASLRIGVAHGSLVGISPDAEGNYFPMDPAELEKLELDFWIVGHTHFQHPASEAEDSFLLIPGCPEPDGFDCRHAGLGWIIEVDDGKEVRKRSITTGAYRFHQETINLDSDTDLEQRLAQYRSAAFKSTLLRLTLKGRLSRERLGVLRKASKDLEEALFWLRIDHSQVAEAITEGIVEAEFSQGSFPYRLLKRLIAAGDDEALQIAYALIQEARS